MSKIIALILQTSIPFKVAKKELMAIIEQDPIALNECNSNYIAPIHAAILSDNTGLLRVLLEKGADVENRAPNSMTPLQLAISFGSVKSFKLLMQKRPDVYFAWYGYNLMDLLNIRKEIDHDFSRNHAQIKKFRNILTECGIFSQKYKEGNKIYKSLLVPPLITYEETTSLKRMKAEISKVPLSEMQACTLKDEIEEDKTISDKNSENNSEEETGSFCLSTLPTPTCFSDDAQVKEYDDYFENVPPLILSRAKIKKIDENETFGEIGIYDAISKTKIEKEEIKYKK